MVIDPILRSHWIQDFEKNTLTNNQVSFYFFPKFVLQIPHHVWFSSSCVDISINVEEGIHVQYFYSTISM